MIRTYTWYSVLRCFVNISHAISYVYINVRKLTDRCTYIHIYTRSHVRVCRIDRVYINLALINDPLIIWNYSAMIRRYFFNNVSYDSYSFMYIATDLLIFLPNYLSLSLFLSYTFVSFAFFSLTGFCQISCDGRLARKCVFKNVCAWRFYVNGSYSRIYLAAVQSKAFLPPALDLPYEIATNWLQSWRQRYRCALKKFSQLMRFFMLIKSR